MKKTCEGGVRSPETWRRPIWAAGGTAQHDISLLSPWVASNQPPHFLASQLTLRAVFFLSSDHQPPDKCCLALRTTKNSVIPAGCRARCLETQRSGLSTGMSKKWLRQLHRALLSRMRVPDVRPLMRDASGRCGGGVYSYIIQKEAG